jgi:hypothetical protein
MPLTFSSPMPFSEAAKRRTIQSILPTTLSSDELEEISSDILERAFFSARTYNAEYLQGVYDTITEFEAGKINQATAILQMKQSLDDTGYSPDDAEAGSITDLGSDDRRLLIVKTQADFGAGYGYYMQTQDHLDTFPAQELLRVGPRQTHRNWRGDDGDIAGEPPEGRWIEAGGTLYDGRMIAPVNDPIWTKISRFGTPYPPFDFNSGMGVAGVDAQTASDLGVVDADAAPQQPQDRGFNDDLAVPADVRNQSLRDSLTADGYSFDGDILTLGDSGE